MLGTDEQFIGSVFQTDGVLVCLKVGNDVRLNEYAVDTVNEYPAIERCQESMSVPAEGDVAEETTVTTVLCQLASLGIIDEKTLAQGDNPDEPIL